MRIRSCLLGLVLALALIGPVAAQTDQQRAFDARKAGQVLPLPEILRLISPRIPARILNAWLEEGRGGLRIYRLKMLDFRGNIIGVVVDARNGQILQVFGPRN
jgi:uncharacterized membrane protein YkoI